VVLRLSRAVAGGALLKADGGSLAGGGGYGQRLARTAGFGTVPERRNRGTA